MDYSPLNITVVEDIEPQRSLVISLLRQEGHRVNGFDSAEAAESQSGSTPIDLLITDLKLPGESGLSLASSFRSAHPDIGIIMLTALDAPDDKVSGYSHGADVYLTKPIDAKELIAVVGAISRRLQTATTVPGPNDPLILNPQLLTLQGSKETITISQNDAHILSSLIHAPEHLLKMEEIYELLQIVPSALAKSALEVRIVRLRKKIRAAGYPLQSIKKIRYTGYKLYTPITII